MKEMMKRIADRFLDDIEDYGVVWTVLRWGCTTIILACLLSAFLHEIIALLK